MNDSNKTFILISGVLIVLLVALFATISQKQLPEIPEQLGNAVINKPKPLQPFTLVDHNGVEFTQDRLKGKWTFLFFGYTHCPDICPNTLGTLKALAKRLDTGPKDGTSIQYLLASVDPARDTPAHLKAYLEYFGPEFLGITGEKTQIDILAKQLGAIYLIDGDTESESYIVNHSATISLLDPHGRHFANLIPPHRVDDMVTTFQRLQNFYRD